MSTKHNFLIVMVMLCHGLLAQEFRATLSGRIIDPSGAGIPDARIEVKSVATAASFSTASAADGNYQVPFLTPGGYTMTVEKEGFERTVREGIELHVAESAKLDVSLRIGSVQQTVQVTANPPLLQTQDADRGLTLENKRIRETPLQGQNIFAQAWSTPGIVVTGSVTRLRPFDTLGTTGIAISGGQSGKNQVLIDGVSNTAANDNCTCYIPTMEAVDEFKVQTTDYDAEYGWTTGGVINIITKGGTNQWHGSAWEFLQNTHLNANTFNSNRNRIPRQSSHINIFGGRVGGPIIHDKLFFTFTYEDIRQVIPDPFVTSVPTALQRTGDFSQTYFGVDQSGKPQLQVIYNPFTTRTGPDGKLIRDPFLGNIIPTKMLNPVAAKVLSLIPEGNVPGNPITGLNNLTNTGSTRKFTDFFPEETIRVDLNKAEKTRMSGRFSHNALSEERSFHYSTTSMINVAETGNNSPFTRNNWSASYQFTHVLSPTTILTFRTGVERFLSQSGSAIGVGFNLASLGFAPQFVSQAVPWFPRFSWAGYDGAGATPAQFNPISQTNSFQASVYKTKGRQSIKTGGEFRLLRLNNIIPGFVAGNFSFDQGFTGADPLRITPDSGNAIASFLLGTASSGSIDRNSDPTRQERLWSAFVEDDVRVTPKFTLNAGLRWDYLGPLTDRFNGLASGFDTTSPSPLQVPGLNLRGGLLFAGAGGNRRGIYDSHGTNFGPRVGLAYELNSRTVLRGGYGLLYAQVLNDPGEAPGFSQSTPMVTSIQTGIPFNTLTNPFPSGILTPVGNTLGLATNLGQALSFADPSGEVPRVHQFSFEIQRELPAQFLVSAAYVGSRGRKLTVDQAINEIPLSALALGATALTRNVPNPFARLVPGTNLNGSTVQQQQLLRPFAQFFGITERFRPLGQSRYDALQVLVRKRLSAGLDFSVAYTYSKTLDRLNFANAQDTKLEKVIDPSDITNNLQISGLYELPFGRGKAFASMFPSAVERLIGGWEISGIARLQSGMPMNFPSNAAPTGVSPVLANVTLDRWFNTCTLLASGQTQGCLSGEQAVWTIRQPFTLQSWSSRLASVRKPRIDNLDLSVMKHNRIGERFDLVFRADFLNATNTPQFFNGPITDVNSGNFGRIAGAMDQSNLPRFIQLSLKLQF